MCQKCHVGHNGLIFSELILYLYSLQLLSSSIPLKIVLQIWSLTVKFDNHRCFFAPVKRWGKYTIWISYLLVSSPAPCWHILSAWRSNLHRVMCGRYASFPCGICARNCITIQILHIRCENLGFLKNMI